MVFKMPKKSSGCCSATQKSLESLYLGAQLLHNNKTGSREFIWAGVLDMGWHKLDGWCSQSPTWEKIWWKMMQIFQYICRVYLADVMQYFCTIKLQNVQVEWITEHETKQFPNHRYFNQFAPFLVCKVWQSGNKSYNSGIRHFMAFNETSMG